MEITYRPTDARSTTNAALLTIMAFVLVAYLVVGLAMPVVPLYVRNNLDLSSFVVGLVAGTPAGAALLSRVLAGRFVDRRGAKPALLLGLSASVFGGLLYTISMHVRPVDASIGALLLGRALLGVADSFVITGALSWGLALLGMQQTGKVMAWVGTAIYAGFAIGAPVGTVLYGSFGFSAVAIATALLPLGALTALAPLKVPSAAAHRVRQESIVSVARVVWQPGVALALSGVGFAVVTAFIALLFADRSWMPAWPAFSALSLAFMLGRLLFGGLPDRVGGAKVAFVCVLIEALGLMLIWLAPSMLVALAGVSLTGLGYSLVYPGLGVEALRNIPSQSRGFAMGAYTALLDLSLGVSSPLLGLIAGYDGLTFIFLISAITVFLAAAMPFWLWRRRRS